MVTRIKLASGQGIVIREGATTASVCALYDVQTASGRSVWQWERLPVAGRYPLGASDIVVTADANLFASLLCSGHQAVLVTR